MKNDPDKKQRKELEQQIKGWTIVGLGPCLRPEESLFSLLLEKNGQRKSVELFATDLGWWFKEPLAAGEHDFVTFQYPSGKVFTCDRCGQTFFEGESQTTSCPGRPEMDD